MILQEKPRAFALWWQELERWDYLSAWLNRAFHVSHPIVPLSHVCRVRWTAVPIKDLKGGEVSLVDKVSFDGEVFASVKRDTKMIQYLAEPGDLIVSKIRARQGSIGLVLKELGNVSVTTHYRVLIPDTDLFDCRYGWLSLRSSYCRAQFLMATGGAMKGEISEENLLEINVPLPPLAVQRGIVARWQRAQDEQRVSQERVNKLKAEIDTQVFTDLGLRHAARATPPKAFAVLWKDMLRWGVGYNQQAQSGEDITLGTYPVRHLGSILELVQYGTSEKANSKGEGVPVLRINNIKDRALDLTDLKYIQLPENVEQGLSLIDGDILIIRTSGSRDLVGTCAVFRGEGRYVFASYLIRLRVNERKAAADFVSWFINSPLGRQQVDSVSRQIMQSNINSEEIRSLQIPLPPIKVQREIMRRVEEGRAEIAREREAAAKRTQEAEVEVEALILGTKKLTA